MQRTLLTAMLVLLVAAAALAVDGQTSAKGVVNVNTASSEQLQLLPRIGPALSERIMDFREVNGPFKAVEELVAVKGIGERSLEQLKPYVVTEGETTLKEKIRLPRQAQGEEES
jgi:competence protein ComEA